MILRRLATGTALAASVVLMTAAPAAAVEDHQAPEVQWVNSNVIVSATDHDVATVLGKYRCWGGNNEQTHLWVSVKQGPQIGLDEGQQTESGYADSWYDTNWNSSPEGDPLTRLDCDGKWQVYRATVKRVDSVPWVPGKTWDQLQDGPALIQFCAFDSTGSEETGFGFSYSMGNVRVPSN